MDTAILECFFDKINVLESGCWEWTGSLDTCGYARMYDGVNVISAHKFSYEYFTKPIPVGLEFDHLCRNRRCVNPEHLEPVTHLENIRRGKSWRLAHPNAKVIKIIRNKTNNPIYEIDVTSKSVIETANIIARLKSRFKFPNYWIDDTFSLSYGFKSKITT
jgi:hypothetical protein